MEEENKYYDDENYQKVEDSNEKKRKIRGVLKEIFEWIICIVIAYVLYLNLNYFIGSVSGVKQASMYPTAKEGEKVILQRPTIFKKELKYGDIITFESPIDIKLYVEQKEDYPVAQYEVYTGITKFLHEFIGVGKVSYIKRVIGVAGDHVVISDDGSVYVNDQKLEESYLREGNTPKDGEYTDLIVPEGTVFVMGDNREDSKDSRYFGCVPISKVNGYVLCRVWPLNKIGALK